MVAVPAFLPAGSPMPKQTILFLAADPEGTDPRALGQEARSIQEELERGGSRDRFAFETRWASKPLDVLRELRRLKPAVVHFSGHGDQDGLFFEAANGHTQLVSAAALAETFGAVGASVRLVVLSACYSEAQAEALLAHVDCVVGMSGAVGRDIARIFAVGFYGGLGECESVAAAHRQGRAAISLEGLSDQEGPHLKVRQGVDAAQLFLAGLQRAAPPQPVGRDHLAVERQQQVESFGRQDILESLDTRETIAHELVREIYARLLAGYPADAAIRTGMLGQIVLRHALRVSSSAEVTLGQLIAEASRVARDALGDDLLGSLYRLNRLYVRTAHAMVDSQGGLTEDAERAAELVIQAAVRFGLVDERAVRDARHAAERQASEPTSTALLRLDRAEQRRNLDDLLALPRRVLVVLIHGEVGQGHDHFGEVAAWRTRSAAKGRWRQISVDWPAPSPSTAMRLGFLLESFASSIGVSFAPPPVPPVADGEAAWIEALEPAISACDRFRERLFVRHVIGWLDKGDIELVTQYTRMVWSRLAARRGEQLVCCLELRRAERAGVPLSRAWRIARAERRIARAIATSLEEQAMPGSGHCAALPELTSASSDDLADWLRAERQLARSVAMAEAQQLVTMTRGGRFDLVVQRLASLNLDTRSSRR